MQQKSQKVRMTDLSPCEAERVGDVKSADSCLKREQILVLDDKSFQGFQIGLCSGIDQS